MRKQNSLQRRMVRNNTVKHIAASSRHVYVHSLNQSSCHILYTVDIQTEIVIIIVSWINRFRMGRLSIALVVVFVC